MVNISIPPHYTGSPSSLSHTPYLTINKDAAEGLDSANAFEGPEKLLEVWFSPSASGLPASARPEGLKAVSQDIWKGMLDLVNCQVLSVIQSDVMDAYLLSESSMFVFPHKLVLKTCGTTTLLLGLPRILEIAVQEAGFPSDTSSAVTAASPHRVFYSRKNFLFPDKQRGPHRSWRDEVHYLDKVFKGGSAYMIGKMNGDHWYLYITAPDAQYTPPMTPEEGSPREESNKEAFASSDGAAYAAAANLDAATDETLEILMTDLDQDNARQFYLEDATRIAQRGFREKESGPGKQSANDSAVVPEGKERAQEDNDHFDVFSQTSSDHAGLATPISNIDDKEFRFPEELTTEGHTLGTVISENCGLADLYPRSKYPDAKIDSYLFTPCGFSANGVVPVPGDASSTHYFTVHVTPEPVCSYASFETNVPERQSGRETAELVAQVVNIFKPGKFSVTLFEAKSGDDVPAKAKKDKSMDCIKGYKRVDRVLHDLEGYELVFRHFERDDWQGGAPRLGERSL